MSEALSKLLGKVGTKVKIRGDSEFIGKNKGVGEVAEWTEPGDLIKGWVHVKFEDGSWHNFRYGLVDCYDFNDNNIFDIELADAEADLFQAIKDRDSEKLSLLLEADVVDVNDCVNSWDETPLTEAVVGDDIGIVECLVEGGADVNKADPNGRIPIQVVCENQFEIAKYLIEKGADINAVNDDGWTALHFAANNNNEDLVKFLLEKGIDASIKNDDGDTALDMAKEYEDGDDLVKAFGENSESDKEFMTELIRKIDNGDIDEARELIESQSDFDWTTVDSCGYTALHSACMFDYAGEVVQLMIDKGVDIEERGELNSTPLYIAVENQCEKIVSVLVSAGADVNAVGSSDEKTPLMEVGEDFVGIAKLLISNGADVNAVDKHGWTALHYAAENNDGKIVSLLLSNGADVIKDGEGKTALDIARSNEYEEVVKIFVENGVFKAEDLFEAVSENDIENIKKLIAAGIDVNGVDSRGDTVLMDAVEGCQLEIVKLLIDAGANVNHVGGSGMTPLMKVDLAEEDIVNFLIDAGADVNAVNKTNGWTALHYFVDCDDSVIVPLLLDAGADVSIKNNKGKTAFDLVTDEEVREAFSEHGLFDHEDLIDAVEVSDFNKVKKLITAGDVDLNFVNEAGYTALQIATLQDDEKLVKMLIDAGADVNFAWEEDGSTPVHFAVDNGCDSALKVLVSAGADVSIKNKDGSTPLELAKIYGVEDDDDDEIIKLLSGDKIEEANKIEEPVPTARDLVDAIVYDKDIDKVKKLIAEGVDVNEKVNNWPPLEYAIERLSEAVPLLISAGADLNSKDLDGNTPLVMAVNYQMFDAAKALIDAGADASIENEIGKTALDIAKSNEANPEIIELLQKSLDKKHVPSTEDLVCAIAEKNLGKIRMMIDEGVDVNERIGTVSMIEQAIYYFPEAIPVLIDGGADINAKDSNGWTALYSAAVVNNVHAVKFLLEAGADVDIENNDGESAYKYAHSHSQRKGVVKIFETYLNDGEIPEVLDEPVSEVGTSKNLLSVIMDAAQRGAIAGTISGSSNVLITKINKMLGNPELLKFGISRPALKAGLGLCLMTLSDKFSKKIPHAEIIAQTSEMLLSAGAEDGVDEIVHLVEPMLEEIFTELNQITGQEQQLLEGEKKDE